MQTHLKAIFSLNKYAIDKDGTATWMAANVVCVKCVAMEMLEPQERDSLKSIVDLHDSSIDLLLAHNYHPQRSLFIQIV